MWFIKHRLQLEINCEAHTCIIMETITSFVISTGQCYMLFKESTQKEELSETVRAVISTCICAFVYDVVFRNVRPNGYVPQAFRDVKGPGLCYLFLVPVAFLVSHGVKISDYLVSAHFTIALVSFSILHQFLILLYLNPPRNQQIMRIWHVIAILPWILTLFVQIAYTFLKLGIYWTIALYIGAGIGCSMQWLVAHYFPKSFTLSEGAILAQSILLFSWQSFSSLKEAMKNVEANDKIYIFTEVAALSTLMVFVLLVLFKKLRTAIMFHCTLVFVALFFALPALQLTLQQNFVLWMFNHIISDRINVILFAFWTLICGSCVGLVIIIYSSLAQSTDLTHQQGPVLQNGFAIQQNQNAADANANNRISTRTRKYFHVIAIITFVPGLYYNVTLTMCAATCGCIVFCMLECIRFLNIAPFGGTLNEYLNVFREEQDRGELILTPIYLLTGFTLPLWFSQSSTTCHLALFSGVISLGIGDSAASWFGSKFGQSKWPNSRRSQEGTVAFIVACLASVWWLTKLGVVIEHSTMKVTLAIVLTALVEAFTSQVDNLVLPLFMYVLLA